MMSNWRYVEVPGGIDLTRQLMPQRPASDMTLCGVDLAWLLEVASMWNALYAPSASLPKRPMSLTPKADDVNRAWTLARNVESSCMATMPSTPVVGVNAVYAGRVPPFGEGTWPFEVFAGEPVRRTDLSDLFGYMAPVRHIVSTVSIGGGSALAWSVSTPHGTPETAPTAPGDLLYRHSWDSYRYTDSVHPDQSHYSPQECSITATGFQSFGCAFPSALTGAIKSVTVYAEYSVFQNGSGSVPRVEKTIWAPIAGTFLSGTISASPKAVSAADIISAAGATDYAFESGPAMINDSGAGCSSVYGSFTLEINRTGGALVAFELAADYTVPQGTTP